MRQLRCYKLVRKLKDGSYAPLFINQRLRYEEGVSLQAEDHTTKGFASRPGFHCCFKPYAPHLKQEGTNRVWIEVDVDDYVVYDRPANQGGQWILAQRLTTIGEINND